MLHIPNFIANRHVPPHSGVFLDNYDPATGQIYSRVADSDETDVADAVQAAQDAFPAWSRTL